MGNGVSTDQGNLPPHGTRDVTQSDDTEQHDWSQLAEAPNTNTALLSNRNSYTSCGCLSSKTVYRSIALSLRVYMFLFTA